MKARLQLILVVDTMAHGQLLRTSLLTKLNSLTLVEPAVVSVRTDESNRPMVVCDGRFDVVTDRNIMREWIRDQIANNALVTPWIISASVSWHACTHDENYPKSCFTTDYHTWNYP